MKVIFMGTPDIAKVCLQSLYEGGHQILAVVTQPDRPAGRGKRPQQSYVKEFALSRGIEVLQPDRVNRGDFPAKLASYNADIFVVAAFGQILSQKVLDIPKYGAVNVHASLLPKLRGAAPVQQAILNGDDTTGITIMQMDAGMDTGDMILKHEVEILQEDTGGSLYMKLCKAAPLALLMALDKIHKGKAKLQPQDHSQATYAPIITKEMARIDFGKTARQVVNFVRGYNPIPAATAEIGGKIIKIWSASVYSNEIVGNAGEVIKMCTKDGIFVQAADGIVQIIEITPPNGKKMTAAGYVRGQK
ncbi:MAG: methionyl-tRNA formyltransferase [Defluviitaleaceae bacterium]|nr:methionyl-tRNA formyltransferase [Defluviitaleaceae bacterium]